MAINSLRCFQNDHLMMIHRYIYVLEKLTNQNPIISVKKKKKEEGKETFYVYENGQLFNFFRY